MYGSCKLSNLFGHSLSQRRLLGGSVRSVTRVYFLFNPFKLRAQSRLLAILALGIWKHRWTDRRRADFCLRISSLCFQLVATVTAFRAGLSPGIVNLSKSGVGVGDKRWAVFVGGI